jgi:hypothetical protein
MSHTTRHQLWFRVALSLSAALSFGCAKKGSDSCSDGWKVIYQSMPGELPPGWGDLAWQDGTLFVGHSDTDASSFIFSIPDHGGARTTLTDGVRHFWLEGAELVFVESAANALDSIPVVGGIRTPIVQFGQSDGSDAQPQALTPLALDGSAVYWSWFDIGAEQHVQRHFRGGGDDADLGIVPLTTLGYAFAFVGQAHEQLVLGLTNDVAGSAVVTVPKALGGTPAALPVPNPTQSTPLAASTAGALLYSQGTQDAAEPSGAPITHYDLVLGSVDGSTPAAFSTTLPRTVAPTVGWATSNGAWVVAGDETDGSGHRLHSIWNVAANGSANELACHAALAPDASQLAVNPSRVTAGVVADGAVFVSLAFMNGSWEIARLDNPGATADVGDAGMPTFDGNLD